MLITDAYRAANEALHAATDFGVTAPRFAQAINAVARRYKALSVLDYGSGPREHVKAMGLSRVTSYDPCVPALSARPQPAHLLVSCDVLEHIEPDLLDNVLDDMAALTLRAAFLTIATGPARKVLLDGRNAHLIQEGSEWWLPRLMERWRLMHFEDIGPELVCIMERKR
jgi:hypothetical protein